MPDPITGPVPAPAPVPTPDTSIRPGADVMKAALDTKRDFLFELPPEFVITHIRLDPSTACGVAIAAVPRIEQHRPAILARFGPEGTQLLDDLPIAAYACEQADTEARVPEDGAEMSARMERILEHHNLLVTEADSLANRKLLDRARIEPARPIQGYRTTLKSTLVLVELYRAVWSQIAGKTFLTLEDLDRIAADVKDMLDALNLRDNGAQRVQAVELRQRALSHLVRVYGEVRRMVTFVRWWEDDADEIAPSLYATRRGRSRSTSGDEPTDLEPAAPAVSPTPASPTPAEPTPVTPIDPVPGSGPAPFTS